MKIPCQPFHVLITKTYLLIYNSELVLCPLTTPSTYGVCGRNPPPPKKNRGLYPICKYINLQMKRRLKYKSFYRMAAARPQMVYEALSYLKEHKNLHYRKVNLKTCKTRCGAKV